MDKLHRHLVLVNIGRECRTRRLIAGITVNEMAERTGYTAGTITQFENGENNNLYLYLCYRGLDHGEKDSESQTNT